ncbi:MAG: acetyl-CoA carboxylase carboxyltransferase subunit beta [Lentisphaerae bacterium]|jgi:acetyl-CoA carboxylase carboxyl transferase subunit beta|nr:acetyl-CoA carboxylase carboxyltransferase subunit beta [Lentisphaerota bacterium]MBT4819419.1 acetyl-CoA carboxylase carboxyltransferase subunit beta [Lentisphaerota bacterium]MBT5605182.1 acetyl-CoA carboxylase carboxyltransferase subunit beta [Lentisphaerota bacterium]MBT7054366.1 acetyl-CoA carboxylase carboxyltransferase subunit beta [Lentisphaerota bacterium]MBT7844850.1 acetyl-CoA carboxylase carboxyltransferase subunit beta [Lentisphaerota bacterium]
MPLFGRKPKYSTVPPTPRREISTPSSLKCKGCGSVIYVTKLGQNHHVCYACGHHYPMTAERRIGLLTDPGSFQEIAAGLKARDVLNFGGDGAYAAKLVSSREKTKMVDAVVCGEGKLDGRPLALGVMDFRFMGASMGSVVGEKITRLTEQATANGLALVVVTASGGARMQEGMLSLMQMAKTSGALARHADAGLPYIVILTHPTTAGVTASYASLGDVIVAEPHALVGFAGARVIKNTTQSELPPGFQTAEFLMERGFIDRVIPRADLRRELSLLLEYFSGSLRCGSSS